MVPGKNRSASESGWLGVMDIEMLYIDEGSDKEVMPMPPSLTGKAGRVSLNALFSAMAGKKW